MSISIFFNLTEKEQTMQLIEGTMNLSEKIIKKNVKSCDEQVTKVRSF